MSIAIDRIRIINTIENLKYSSKLRSKFFMLDCWHKFERNGWRKYVDKWEGGCMRMKYGYGISKPIRINLSV